MTWMDNIHVFYAYRKAKKTNGRKLENDFFCV